MSEIADQSELVSKWQLQLDELATDLLLNGPDNNVLAGLKQLSEDAGAAGFFTLAQAATQIVGELSSQSLASAEVDEQFRKGLIRIQRILSEPIFPAPQELSSSAPKPEGANSLAQDPELIGDFITESREHLVSIEKNMLTLEKSPEEKESVHAVFRGFHTIKGLAGFLELLPIRDVAHEVETLLDLARNEKLAISAPVVDVVLESVDYLKQTIQVVESSLTGNASEGMASNPELLARLQRLIAGGAEQQRTEEAAPPAMALLAVALNTANSRPQEQVEAKQNSDENAAAVIRVHTAKLDSLMDMVGEMVITQSLIRHNPALSSLQNPKLIADLSQLARITSDVQRTTMAMRMVTMGSVFQRSSRLVRDLSRKSKKKIELQISGEDTEVDKTIAEELADPLLHMVRNACDHGVDTPEERAAAGKKPVAIIQLAAYHQGGQIVIQISDDGRGLDKEKILAKASQKGLVDSSANLSEQEVFNLIFEPGFSTAAQITDLSGRGVGMDVVRRNVQKLRGRIDIQSRQGQGTTFFLKLPLTLAIIEGLVVGVGQHRYIVPIFAVRELISPKPQMLSTVHGRNEMAVVRDHVLPVIRLSRTCGVVPKSENLCDGLLIVTECQEQHFCLAVDQVLGKQEVVIKSLGETLKNITGIAGGAILGDGKVGLILDLEGVFHGHRS